MPFSQKRKNNWRCDSGGTGRGGFTMLELLVALALLTVAMAITFSTFYSVSKAWQRGTAMAETLDHGEYVTYQMICALRSTFYPAAQSQPRGTNAPPPRLRRSSGYGFSLENNGSGERALDVISWVKAGTALLGVDDPLSKGLHRIQLSVESDGSDIESGLAVRAWRPYANPLDFDPADVEPRFLSSRVLGLDCRVAIELEDGDWDWLEDWEDENTNRLPRIVEFTLYLEPPGRDEPPVVVQRTVEIPAAPLSWERAPRP